MPFPLLISCALIIIIVSSSWFKYRTTLIPTNLIAGFSIVESIGIFVQLILAYQMGVYSTFSLTLIAALFLYGSNLFFGIVFLKQVKHDNAFKHWTLIFVYTHKSVFILGTIINFKFFRVIYGRLFDKDRFNAAFDEP